MSYDLSFRPGPRPAGISELSEYFSKARGFVALPDRYGYDNRSTGVYFGFDVVDAAVPVAFNINYFRPHTFGLEAERVLTGFVRHFRVEVDDPQSEGMATGPYSPKGFLRGWNAGNRSGYRAFLSESDVQRPLMLSTPRLEALWRWNQAKEPGVDYLVDRAGETPPCYLPTAIFVVTPEQKLLTCVIWDLKMAIAIPEVDLVISRGDNGMIGMSAPDALRMLKVHSTWPADLELARGYPTGMQVQLVDELTSGETQALKKEMAPLELQRVAPDKVLTAELVEEAMGIAAD